MARIDPPDPQLVERIRSVLGHGYGWSGSGVGDRSGGAFAQGGSGEGGSAEAGSAEGGSGEGRSARRASAPLESAESSWVPDPPPGSQGPRVLTLPSFVRETRRRVGRRALSALVGVAVAAALVFAVRVQLAAHEGEPVAVAASRSGLVSRSLPAGFTSAGAAGTGAAGLSAGNGSSGGGSTSAGGGGPPTVVVHVVGEVARPGVVVLPSGSRISDAMASVGGALTSADLERVNLARVLADGEQIHVPAPGEALLPGSNAAPAAGGPGSAGANPTGAAAPIDLNTADAAALDTLPGVGPVLAQRILQWRAQHGRFSTVDELNEVSGIGDKLFAELRSRVTV